MSGFVNWERSWNPADDAILAKTLEGIITNGTRGRKRFTATPKLKPSGNRSQYWFHPGV